MAESKSTTIRIDGDVYDAIKEAADKYGMQFSSPNKVLRVMLGIDREGR